MERFGLSVAGLVLAGLVCACSAQERDVVVAPHALGGLDVGQVVKGAVGQNIDTGGIWQEHAFLRLAVDATIKQRSRVIVGLEGMLRFGFPMSKGGDRTIYPQTDFYLHQAEGRLLLGPIARPWGELAIGYFPYKYNPEAANLGEYLFRTGTYPPFIITDFDFPMARLLGLRFSTNIDLRNSVLTNFRQDLLLTSRTDRFPTQNWTLSFIPAFSLARGVADLGLGCSLVDLFSVFGERYVSPPKPDNMYLENVRKDPIVDTIVHADTGYYTFRGMKLMGRLTVDPKRIWARDGDFGILGTEDLKLYCETAILGVKNYPSNDSGTMRYDDRRQRWPVTAGFNLPAFRLLDVLSVEVEYFPGSIPNSYQIVDWSALPVYEQAGDTARDYSADDIKWSIYARRSFGRHFSLRALVASDHMRIMTNDKSATTSEENLRASYHWHWILRAVFEF